MTIERIHPSGAWRIYESDKDGYLVSRQYMGYTKREALAMFREELRETFPVIGRAA